MKLSERHLLRITPQQPAVVNVMHAPRDYRKELWIQVAAATARADNCTKPSSPGTFANRALEDFDKRFEKEGV